MTYKHLETNPTTENILLDYGNDPKYDYLHQTKEPSTTNSETLSAPAYASTPTEQPSPFTPSKQENNTPDNMNDLPIIHVNDKYGSYKEQFNSIVNSLKRNPIFNHLNYLDYKPDTKEKEYFQEMHYENELKKLSHTANHIRTTDDPDNTVNTLDNKSWSKNTNKMVLQNNLITIFKKSNQTLSIITADKSPIIPEDNPMNLTFSDLGQTYFHNSTDGISAELDISSKKFKELTTKHLYTFSDPDSHKTCNRLIRDYPAIFQEIIHPDGSFSNDTLYTTCAVLLAREEYLSTQNPVVQPITYNLFSDSLNELNTRYKPDTKFNLNYKQSKYMVQRLVENCLFFIEKDSGAQFDNNSIESIIKSIQSKIKIEFNNNPYKFMSEADIKHYVLSEFQLHKPQIRLIELDNNIHFIAKYSLESRALNQSIKDKDQSVKRDRSVIPDNISSHINSLSQAHSPESSYQNDLDNNLSEYSENIISKISENTGLSVDYIKSKYLSQLRIISSDYRNFSTAARIFDKYPDFRDTKLYEDINLHYKTLALISVWDELDTQLAKDEEVTSRFYYYLKTAKNKVTIYENALENNEAELEKLFPLVFIKTKNDGIYSKEETTKALKRFVRNNIELVRHEYDVSRKFFEIMTERDLFHNVDAVFLNIFYNIANGLGADFVTEQLALNKSVELANKHGASPLGEELANISKDCALAIGLLAASFFAPEIAIPAQIIALYGGAETVSELRNTYRDLKMNNCPPDQIATALIKQYATKKFSSFAGKKASKIYYDCTDYYRINNNIKDIGTKTTETVIGITTSNLLK